jgi:predicted RNase H-like nuclease/ppGpp synthetase/RelA/SpoT-type nucleotidyltranferase
MHFVGLDLAWGENKPTGLAVLDGAGSLVRVSAHDTDASIVEALAPYVQDDCLVGIDAPLVVPNATGNRPCEAALNRDFARFDAGAHPSNTGKPELAGEPRGAKVARLLGLDIDPVSTGRRRAVEVYPHPATIALFRLGRTLKYKNKPGRTLARMRAELLRLVELLEGLEHAEVPLRLRHHAPWRALVAAIGAAGRKSELRRAEDQVDAVVCAYVAQFAVRRPQLTTTYGDLATGYIVTPTLPAGHRPSPRQPRDPEPVPEPAPEPAEAPDPSEGIAPPVPVDSDPVRAAVRTYAAMQPELRRATDRYVALVTRLLDDAGINYLSVTGRAKSVASFAAKADRTVEGVPLFRDPLEEITDQVGVRVITYLRSDVTAVADLLGDQLEVLDDRDMGQETARQGRFGYASRHLLVRVEPDRGAAAESLRGRRAQVQVRTVLQHAWAEFEHAIRYKGTIPEEHAPGLDRRFTLAAGLLELADREFSMIRDQLQATVSDRPVDVDASDPRIAAEDLATFLAGRYADAGWSRTDHYAWVSGLLLELGITSLDELAGLLTSVDSAAINARMDYRYPPGAVRRLDDALLAVFGPAYLELHGNSHRTDLLRARLDRLRGSADDVKG